jgi:hypothetical protein
MERMGKFPPGGWDFNGIDDFGDWANTLREALEPNKTVRTIILTLKSMSAELAKVSVPLEMDDYETDDEDCEDVGKGKGTIRVQRRTSAPFVPARADALPDYIAYEPKVC